VGGSGYVSQQVNYHLLLGGEIADLSTVSVGAVKTERRHIGGNSLEIHK